MNDTTVTVVGMVCSEIRYTQGPDETPTARFQIRTTHRRYDKRTNTWTDGDPSYYSAACRRTLADHVVSSMGVGDPVVATGRLRISRWRRGEENMISAEIDVQAIGHDLRWGTTVYRRTTPPTRIPGPGRARGLVATGTAATAATADAADASAAEREVLVPTGAAPTAGVLAAGLGRAEIADADERASERGTLVSAGAALAASVVAAGPGRARSTAAAEEAAETEALVPVGATSAADSLADHKRQKPGREVVELPVAA